MSSVRNFSQEKIDRLKTIKGFKSTDEEVLPDNWHELEGFKDKTEEQAIEILRSIKVLAELSFILYTVTKKQQESNSKVIDINRNNHQINAA